MSPKDEGSPTVLAVFIGPAPAARSRAGRSASLRAQQLSFVTGLLEAAGGREVDLPAGHAGFIFGTWPAAVEAAIALTTEVPRLTTHLAGMEVGVGLDLSDAADEAAIAARAAALAQSAAPNEIRLGQALAAVATQDPPDYHVVRPIDDDPSTDLGPVYRLAGARDEVPNNLVDAVTSFVGREAEIGEVRHLLGDARLVTLSGPPGVGKTRLAGQIAERVLGRFDDGAWFVALAPIADPSLVLPTVAEAVGMSPATDRSMIDAITAHLQGRRVLLVLDNFEHVTEATTDVAKLLASATGLHLLVTSRSPLHISGEHEYPLRPLGLPDLDGDADELIQAEAVELFASRAAASQPTFRLSEANALQVGELCRRLDGLPLAIELAAARVKLLPLPAILARLDRRLALLTGGPRDFPARHQSLRAAIAWSYELLEPSAKELFQRLAVFRGGWSLDGAAAVWGASTSDEVVETLRSLLDASLLVRRATDAAVPRFTMLETIREYAAELLDEEGDADAVRARHAAFYLELVQRTEPEFTAAHQAAALDQIAMDHDNIRAALDYLFRTKPEDALRLSASMWRFWQMRGHLLEGGQWITGALEKAGEDTSDEARATALAAAGGLAYWRGEYDKAEGYYQEALDIRRRIGDEMGIAGALYDLAFVFFPGFLPPPEDPNRTAKGIRLLEEAGATYQRAGDEAGVAKSDWGLGSFLVYSDLERASTLLQVSVERFRSLNDPFGLGWALRSYGRVLLAAGESASSTDAISEALRLFVAAQDGSAMGLLLDDFAEIAHAEGDIVRGARLRGAAAGLRHLTEAEIDNEVRIGADATVNLTDPAALERAWSEGQAMSQAEAAAYALRDDAVATSDHALRVTALGSFAVLRSGQPVSHWGGPKAGSRQAQAMFAFLLDRGERGVTKDEFIEVIWPDAELAQADLNFHRTVGGLRTTLEPNRGSESGQAVLFANGRYRLGPSVVGWLDVAEFEQRLVNAAQATDDAGAIRGLEAARSLYRGDYLDDCPLYGDSEYVEERRRFLRGRMTDALVDLGRRYETRGEQSVAAERFREALTVSGGDCPSASDGLERLGVNVA